MSITLHLRRVRTHSIIGVHPEERMQKQSLFWDVDLQLREMPMADQLEQTVSYVDLCRWVEEAVESLEPQLLEILLQRVAASLRTKVAWKFLRLTVHKPQAIPHLQDVAVTLELGEV